MGNNWKGKLSVVDMASESSPDVPTSRSFMQIQDYVDSYSVQFFKRTAGAKASIYKDLQGLFRLAIVCLTIWILIVYNTCWIMS
jgi:hypothetical protein